MENPNTRVFTQEDINRLKEIVNEGCSLLTEIDTLKEGLTDTVKNVAEEMDIKPAQLMKAIKIANKMSLSDEQSKFSEIEEILAAAGRG